MKKTLLALTLMACPLMAQEAAPAQEPAPAPAPAATPSGDALMYAGMVQQMLGCVDELADIMANVKDKDSADAAAPRVQKLVVRGLGIFMQLQGMPELTPEVMQEVQNLVGPQATEKLQGVLPKLMGSVMPLMMNGGYGSTSLNESIAPMLQNLMGSMMGGQGMNLPGLGGGTPGAAPQLPRRNMPAAPQAPQAPAAPPAPAPAPEAPAPAPEAPAAA